MFPICRTPPALELPDGRTGPNDGGCEKTETRSGPPLDYVAEKGRRWIKMRRSIN
jgi:hypothetical protein